MTLNNQTLSNQKYKLVVVGDGGGTILIRIYNFKILIK